MQHAMYSKNIGIIGTIPFTLQRPIALVTAEPMAVEVEDMYIASSATSSIQREWNRDHHCFMVSDFAGD